MTNLCPSRTSSDSGFLNEKPLAKLRQDMAQLGIARAEKIAEPEDHMGTLCEIMAGLITGEFGPPAELAAQRRFFDAHIAPWATRFFTDLEMAQAAKLYAPVGRLGRVFTEIEAVRSEEHTSELQSLMRISYAVFCLKKKRYIQHT